MTGVVKKKKKSWQRNGNIRLKNNFPIGLFFLSPSGSVAVRFAEHLDLVAYTHSLPHGTEIAAGVASLHRLPCARRHAESAGVGCSLWLALTHFKIEL